MSIKSNIIEAHVLEATTGILLADGNEKSLTKVITIEGDLVSVWHDDNKLHASPGEDVLLVRSESQRTDANGNPYINYAIVPAAFAAKIKQPK